MKFIYQTNGKPLSQQALYQQKLKQGIYNSPNVTSVGVNSNASDTAALLAASSDLTVKPSYERTVAQEAQEAALAAKLEQVYQWSRTVDPEAANAATSSLYGRHDSISSKTTIGTGIVGNLDGNALYTAASKNSTSTMTSRINPEKNHKHGLVPKTASVNLDINKISSIAKGNSTRTMDSRINPALDVGRSGLTKENTTGFQAKDISGQYLLSAANAKATDRLNSLKYSKPEDFKAQAQLYANALAVAQQKSNERMANNKLGLIDLGGGLTVTSEELTKMASLIVDPVLADINAKAEQQRELDKAREVKRQEAVKAHDAAKRAELEERQKEKEELEKAKQERIEANNNEKTLKNDEFTSYQETENSKVSDKLEELRVQEEEHEAKRQELLGNKQENQDKIDNEEQELIASRKQELETMQQERDVELEPILGELGVETEKLNDLTNTKDELSSEVDKLTAQNNEFASKLKELEEQLAKTEEEIESTSKELEESQVTLDDSHKEIKELTESTTRDHNNIKEETDALEKEINDLEDKKKQHLEEKAKGKDEIRQKLKQRVADEHAINDELPDHLRKSVNEKKLLDTSSIFSDEPIREPEPEPKPAVVEQKSEPVLETKPKGIEKRRSTIKRISSIFKRKSSGGQGVDDIKTSLKPKEPIAKAKEEIKSSKTSQLEDIYDDDISTQNNNKGGVFKEEL